MALIVCAECSSQVSNKANSCPRCGAPVSLESRATDTNLTTTQTTSKKLKRQYLFAVLLIFIGAIWMATSFQTDEPAIWAPVVIVLGLVWAIIVKIRTWWHHG
ncbi:hypothetical protein [Marinihelvus fidelis]|uniref:hypothetical protein n=1 Tax=Marinihelvus fidelis TaxID=2613842 RepID=UPI001CD21A13|nr:hypothetical protein [Marinihelvus fidelis]